MSGVIRIPQVTSVSVQRQPERRPQTPLSLGRDTSAAAVRGIAAGVDRALTGIDQVRRDAKIRKVEAQFELDNMNATNAITGWHEGTGTEYAEQSNAVTGIAATPGVNADGSIRKGFDSDMAEFERNLRSDISKSLTPNAQAIFDSKIGLSRASFRTKTAGHQATQGKLAQKDSEAAEAESFVYRASSISEMGSPEGQALQDDVLDHVNRKNISPEDKAQLGEQMMAAVVSKVVDNSLFIKLRSDPRGLKAELEAGEFDPFLDEGQVSQWIGRADTAISKIDTAELDATAQPIIDDLMSNWDQINTQGGKGEKVVRQLFPTNHPFVKNADGSVSNVKLSTFEQDGVHYVIPTMVDGKQLTFDEAFSVARVEGLSNYPSFSTAEAALSFSREFHGDINEQGQLVQQGSGALTSNQTRAKIKKDYDGALEDELLDRWDAESKAFENNQKKQENIRQQGTQTAVEALLGLRDFDGAILQVNLSDTTEKFKIAEKKRIRDIQQGKSNLGNMDEYIRLLTLSGTDRDKFLSEMHGVLELGLTTPNQSTLTNIMTKMITGDVGPAHSGFTFAQAGNKAIAPAKIGDDEDERNQWWTRFQEDVNRFEATLPDGRKATGEEMLRIGNSLTATVDFDFFNQRAFEFPRGDTSEFNLDEITDPNAVPIIDANAIIADRRAAGQSIDPQSILSAWKRGILNPIRTRDSE